VCRQLSTVREASLGINAFIEGAKKVKGTKGCENLITARRTGDAQTLITHAVGLAFEEGPTVGCPLRLRYNPTTRVFYIAGNEMDYDPFIALQNAVESEFLVKGLKFHRMLDGTEDAPHVSHAASLVVQPAI